MQAKESRAEPYGIELILDLHGCDPQIMTVEKIKRFLLELCEQIITMKRHGEPLVWDDRSDDPKLNGVSAMQFIETSTVTIHALRLLEKVFINVFSCESFHLAITSKFCKEFFRAKTADPRKIIRN